MRPAREAIAANRKAPAGLRDLAADETLMKSMRVTARELRTLASIDLPTPITKDGYIQLLIAIRSVAGGR